MSPLVLLGLRIAVTGTLSVISGVGMVLSINKIMQSSLKPTDKILISCYIVAMFGLAENTILHIFG